MFFLVFSLIKAVVWLLLLPFKILWEIAEHSSRRRHHNRRRRPPPARRGVPPMQPRAFTPRASGPTGPSHWQSLAGGRKALIIGFPLALVVLIAAGAAAGSPAPSHPSGTAATQAPAAGTAQAAGITAPSATSPAPVKHHHKRHHRRHHHVVVPPAPAPTPAGCYPIAASGNCYQPGEFCPHADAGMTGVAGDGKQITCENNNGLRWEPT